MHISHCKFYRKTGESKSFLFALLVICAASVFSCSTDFKVNAPYKEENAVYGLLELHNNTQIIKIGKVYQNGPGVSASQAAQQVDSLYNPDSLQVSLSDNNTGELTKLSKFYNTQKLPGYFVSPGQYLYGTSPGFTLNPAHKYSLLIYDPKTKVQSQATTSVVNNIIPVNPFENSSMNISNPTGLYQVKFNPGANATTYDVNIYIPVREYKKSDSSLIKADTLVFNVLANYPTTPGASSVVYAFRNIEFYQFIGASFTADPSVYRIMDSLDFEITGAANDLANYIQVNQPSQGIVQKKPDYTNISNGVGIFSSRLITHIHVPLTEGSFTYLQTSQYTRNLNFTH